MGFIVSALGGIFATLAGLIIFTLATISGFVLRTAVNIFTYFSSENFIKLSYTNLADNPFLAVGWTLTRDLTNIVFVVILIAIGLGTALKLGDFDARKTLPKLIMIALLINFTPVILGVLVDAANIIMNFFIGDGFASGNYFVNASATVFQDFLSLLGGKSFFDPTASGELMGAALAGGALLVFNIIATFIFIVFSILFIMRYVAIWTLVILSPFAFAASILPATKKWWNEWWENFIKWNFIGVIAAFFLYLTDHLMFVFKDIQIPIGDIAGAPMLAPIISKMLPYIFVIIFLTIGFGATISFAPQAAQGVISGSRNAGKKVTGWAKRTAGSAASGIRSTTPIRRGEEWTRRKMEAVPGLNRMPGLRPGTVEISRTGQISGASEALKKIPDTPQGNKDIFARISQFGVDARTRAAGLQILAERKALGENKEDKDKVEKLLKETVGAGLNISAVYKARPDLAGLLGLTKDTNEIDPSTGKPKIDKRTGKPIQVELSEDDAIAKVMKKLDPQELVKNLQKNSLQDPRIIKAILDDERKLEYFARQGKAEMKESFKETLRNSFDISKLEPEERKIYSNKVRGILSDPRWNPTEKEKEKAAMEEIGKETVGKIIKGTEEEFKKTRSKYPPGAFK